MVQEYCKSTCLHTNYYVCMSLEHVLGSERGVLSADKNERSQPGDGFLKCRMWSTRTPAFRGWLLPLYVSQREMTLVKMFLAEGRERSKAESTHPLVSVDRRPRARRIRIRSFIREPVDVDSVETSAEFGLHCCRWKGG